ncbi:MAG TPA: DUF721 domain-containing protein [Candidatus Competibacter sp.]|nr:DUF721 domain-containing protein [Candidatus Competibacter sp.]HRX62385.1 DUF721 domain-containing protein [Candidatus Competibacter sp.]HUM90125.1 DUF721 domain-containing protein [Candidatus Competibacter sp.]
MADSDDARASARRHTAQLLKMLRGHGPTADAASTIQPVAGTPDPPAVAVADTPVAYSRRSEPGPTPRAVPDPVTAGTRATIPPDQPAKRGSIPAIGEVLYRQRGVLGELVTQAEKRVRLSRIFHAYLPPHLRDHAELIRLDEEKWTVHTDSSSWATRLRYALHNIRDTLGQQLGFPLPKPHIRVVPPTLPLPVARPPLRLTPKSAKLLEIAARNLSDERLSAALRRLAAHADPAR